MRYLLLILVLVACSSTTEITGEVYVVTKDRHVVKLSGSEVFIRDVHTSAVIANTTTDAEGIFKVTVPRGAYEVEVMESRTVGNQTEFYKWKVPVHGHVVLNNSNLINLTP